MLISIQFNKIIDTNTSTEWAGLNIEKITSNKKLKLFTNMISNGQAVINLIVKWYQQSSSKINLTIKQ